MRLNLTPNLLSPQKHINSDWVRVWSFSENVEVTETSYQMSDVLSFCDQEKVQPPSLKVTVLTFLVKNGKRKLSGKSIF